MKGRSRIGGNALSLGGQTFFVALLALFRLKILAVALEPKDFALFLGLSGLAMLLSSVALFGLPQVAVRFLPPMETRGEGGRALRFSMLLMLLMLVAFALLLPLARLGGDALVARFALGDDGAALLEGALLLALAFGLAEMSTGLLQGLRRMGWAAAAEVGGALLLVGHLFLLRSSLDVAATLHLVALYFFLRSAFQLIVFPFLLPRQSRASGQARDQAGSIGRYWGQSLLLRWLAVAYMESDRFLLRPFLKAEFVSFYHAPARVVAMAKKFLAAPVLAFQTEVSRFHEERRDGEIAVRLQLFMKSQLALSLWLAAALFLLARPLILLLSTEDYLAGLPVFFILLATLPLGSLSSPVEAALRGGNGLGRVMIGNLLFFFCYFGSFPFLVRDWQLVGLGLAQVMAAALQAGWIIGVGLRAGWLRGARAPLGRGVLWGLLPAAAAILLALLAPGAAGLTLPPMGIIAGLGLLSLSVLLVLRSEKLLSQEEKRILLERLPLARGYLVKVLNLGGGA